MAATATASSSSSSRMVTDSPTAALPASLRRLINEGPSDCKPGLALLYDRFKFTEDQYEAFMVNNKADLNLDTLLVFEEFLEKDYLQRQAALTARPMRGRGSGLGRRESSSGGGGSSSSRGVSAKLGGGGGLGGGLGGFTSSSSSRRESLAGGGRKMSERERERDRERRKRKAHQQGQAAFLAAELPMPAQKRKSNPSKQVEIDISSQATPAIAVDLGGGGNADMMLEVLGDTSLWTGQWGRPYKWMDEALHRRNHLRDERMRILEERLVSLMRQRHPNEEPLHIVLGQTAQDEVIVCGRVVSEAAASLMNDRSMLLEGYTPVAMFDKDDDGERRTAIRVSLNIVACKSVLAFPGQVVCVLGRPSSTGTAFYARDFVGGLSLPSPPASLPSSVPSSAEGKLRVFVLAGPFSLENSLDYSALETSLRFVGTCRPHLVVLLGPFLDASNQRVSSGEPMIEEDEGIETFDGIYRDIVLPTLQRSLVALRQNSPETIVAVVPSLEEILNFHPLPQPGLDTMLAPMLMDPHGLDGLRGVQFLPNPVHLQLENQVLLSITSADVLMPVLRSGLVLRPEEKRLDAAAKALLLQRSLFPVLPRDPAQVSESRAQALNFPEERLPDAIVSPTQVGDLGGTRVAATMFANPGSVCGPTSRGGFVELRLNRKLAEGCAPGGGGGSMHGVQEVVVHRVN